MGPFGTTSRKRNWPRSAGPAEPPRSGMAEEIQISGTNAVGKIRNPLGVVGLTFITIGIYFFFWYYKVNKEMAEIGRARNTEELGTSPTTSLMAILFGWI